MSMMDISTSVVVFNTDPNDLSRLLAGFAGTRLRVQVTVVDNSNGDSLSGVARQHGADYIRPGRNLGYGGGNNVVLRRMLGQAKYHLVINPDIVTGPDAVERMYRLMEEHPRVGQAMPRVLYPDGRPQSLCKLLPTPADLFVRRFLGRWWKGALGRQSAQYELHGMDLSRSTRVPCLSGCFMFLRDAVLRQIGLFDERYPLYMEDVDLCRRVGEVAATVFFPEVSVTHGYAKGSYRRPELLRYHVVSAVRYFNKWGWWFDRGRRALNELVDREATAWLLDDLDRGRAERELGEDLRPVDNVP
jgi:GT2 family glycosyltransferase